MARRGSQGMARPLPIWVKRPITTPQALLSGKERGTPFGRERNRQSKIALRGTWFRPSYLTILLSLNSTGQDTR